MRFNFILYAVVISSIICCFSCRKEVQQGKIIPIDISTNKQSLSSVVSKFEIHPLETSDSSLIGSASKFKLYHNNYYILDRRQKTIFQYDSVGNFVKKLKKIGKGPEEYLDISDFTINPYNGNFEFVDGKSYYSYDKNCRFISKTTIATGTTSLVHKLEIINKDLIAFISLLEDEGAMIYSRRESKIVKKQNIFDKWIKRKIPFGSITPLLKSSTSLLYQEAFSNYVYKVDSTGYNVEFQWDFGKYNFDINDPTNKSELQNHTLSENRERVEYFKNKYITGFQYILESPNYIITTFSFKKDPIVLLTNKKSKKYVILSDKLCRLFFNPIAINSRNQLFIVVDVGNLKYLVTEEFFNKESKELITKMDISNNPVVLELDLKDNLFK